MVVKTQPAPARQMMEWHAIHGHATAKGAATRRTGRLGLAEHGPGGQESPPSLGAWSGTRGHRRDGPPASRHGRLMHGWYKL